MMEVLKKLVKISGKIVWIKTFIEIEKLIYKNLYVYNLTINKMQEEIKLTKKIQEMVDIIKENLPKKEWKDYSTEDILTLALWTFIWLLKEEEDQENNK